MSNAVAKKAATLKTMPGADDWVLGVVVGDTEEPEVSTTAKAEKWGRRNLQEQS
jgi:hypothetical protein